MTFPAPCDTGESRVTDLIDTARAHLADLEARLRLLEPRIAGLIEVTSWQSRACTGYRAAVHAWNDRVRELAPAVGDLRDTLTATRAAVVDGALRGRW